MLYKEQCSRTTPFSPFHSQRQMVGQSLFLAPSSLFTLYCPSTFLLLKLSTFSLPYLKWEDIYYISFYGTDYSKNKLLIHFEDKGFVSFFKGKLGASKWVKLFWLLGNIKTSSTGNASWLHPLWKCRGFSKN